MLHFSLLMHGGNNFESSNAKQHLESDFAYVNYQEVKTEQKETKHKQVKPGETSEYEITHYTAYCTGCSGVTASGYNVRDTIYYNGYRIVAAPASVAFYTKLKITYKDGTSINAIVLDRGGDIKTGRLDLLVKNKGEAYSLGRQQVAVEIIK